MSVKCRISVTQWDVAGWRNRALLTKSVREDGGKMVAGGVGAARG